MNGSDLYYWEQYEHNNTHDNLINHGESTNGSNEWNGTERNGRTNTHTVCTVFAITTSTLCTVSIRIRYDLYYESILRIYITIY